MKPMTGQTMRTRLSQVRYSWAALALLTWLLLILVQSGVMAQTATPPPPVVIPAGDTAALAAAIADANATCTPGNPTVLQLTTSTYTLTTPAVADISLLVNCDLVIDGNGSTIERNAGASNFRIFQVADGATLTARDLTVRGGRLAAGNGAGIRVYGGLILNNVTLRDHVIETNGNGGAIMAVDARVRIEQSRIENNTIIGDIGSPEGRGGGIYIQGNGEVAPYISNTLIVSNNAIGYGGGLYTLGAQPTIEDSIIQANIATYGGGVGFEDSDYLLLRSQIIDNAGAGDSAGLWQIGGTGVFNDGVIARNITGGAGAAITSPGLTIQNSCIFENDGSDSDVRYPEVIAPNNWWGDATGPSGAGPGSGDSIDPGVVYAPFLTAPPAACNAVPTATFTPSETLTPSLTPTFTETPSDTPEPTPTPSESPEPTATFTQSDTPEPTETSEPTFTPSYTASSIPSPTATTIPTSTNTPVPTNTASVTPTSTNTLAPTLTPTITPSSTPSQNITLTTSNTTELINAIVSANSLCVGNQSVISINLASNGDYVFTAPYVQSGTNETALPVIRCNIIINGNNSVLRRAAGSPAFRFFKINGWSTQDNGRLTLNDLTLENGLATGVNSEFGGGAIYVSTGQLELSGVTLRNN
jgi:hypothetical protein